MIISNKHEFVFIKSRKTAGSTLEKLVFQFLGTNDVCTGSPRDGTPSLNDSTGLGHMPWVDIKRRFPNQWGSFFKFTIERNPWDKVVSSYFWHKEIKPERFGNMGFEEYVLTCELLPMDWKMYSFEDKPLVDKIYKYEEMDAMYNDLNERFGLSIPLTQVNNTKLKSGIRKVSNYRELHTNATIERVATLFKNEIELLGYTYE